MSHMKVNYSRIPITWHSR